MRVVVAILCAVLPWTAACSIGPTDSGSDQGTGASAAAARTVGDQCDDVITEFCEQGARCAIQLQIQDCVDNYLPLCCTGTACNVPSTVSESTVSACKTNFDTEDCNLIVNTSDPGSCL